MRFPEKGRTSEALLAELRARKHADLPWAEGRVFAYVYDGGPEAMRLIGEAMRLYMTEGAPLVVQPQLGVGPSPANIHLSIGVANVPNVEAFLADLRTSVEAVKQAQPALTAESMAALLPPADQPAAETIANISAALGLDGAGLPSRMDGLNNLLERMPADQRDRLFVEFTNRLYGCR